MRAFANKTAATRPTSSALFPRFGRAEVRAGRVIDSIVALKRTSDNWNDGRAVSAGPDRPERFSDAPLSGPPGHDFSRIVVHAAPPGKLQPKLAIGTPGDIFEEE